MQPTDLRFSAPTHYQLGSAMGKHFAQGLQALIERFLDDAAAAIGLDRIRLVDQTSAWFEALPERFQQELKGIAAGSGCPLSTLTSWYCHDQASPNGCTSFLVWIDSRLWVGRNNDYILPAYWGHTTELSVDGFHTVRLFGLPCESFSGTGCNGDGLWLHYNWLPDAHARTALAPNGKDTQPQYVMLRHLLETCSSLADVEVCLSATSRRGSMALFVVDGKTQEGSVFMCTASTHRRYSCHDNFLVAANHFWQMDNGSLPVATNDSLAREHTAAIELQRILAAETSLSGTASNTIHRLQSVLGHPGVEQSGAVQGTVYATVCCPHTGELWYTTGGYPAASRGRWQRIVWPSDTDSAR